MIKKLWQHFSLQRKKQFLLLLLLMLASSLMEIISIGAVVPFLGVLTSPEQVFNHSLAQPLIQFLKIKNHNQLLLPLIIIFILATLIAASVRLLTLYVSTRFSYAVGADLSLEMYKRTLYQDYLIHTSRNSSDIINSIITKTNTVINGVLVPVITIIISMIITLGIISIIFVINTNIALLTFFIFALLYAIIAFLTKKSLSRNSVLISHQSTQMVKFLQEGLGGIRDVLIDGSQDFYCKLYQNANVSFRRASGDNVFISSSSRYIMEAIGMIAIAILACQLTLNGGINEAIPLLGTLALGAQKMLPALQQTYRSYSIIKGATSSFMDVLKMLDQPMENKFDIGSGHLLAFKHTIEMKNLDFRYSKEKPSLFKNINLSFKKGKIYGFVGKTGCGKSTLLDILMGLLEPINGQLLIDGTPLDRNNRRAWQEHISHVPQNVYLTDSSIMENIAFGIDPGKIDLDRVMLVAKKAQLSEVVDNLKHKYSTIVGERGFQLSGGQRQRIGIARALYKESDVIIFDEATSALDEETERKIINEIAKLKDKRTVFIIAHRITSLKYCDKIIRLNNNHSFEEVEYKKL